MFPDWKIAQSYRQGQTKMKYVLQYGIAPFVKEQMIRDFKLQLFSFKFDKTTTNQVKIDDCYVQFWSSGKRTVPNATLLTPVVVYNTIRLLIQIVNSTSVVIIIK